MRNLKLLMAGILLMLPALAAADALDVPGSATWYLHVDLRQMQSDDAGRVLYGWLEDEVFSEVKENAGVDIGKELDQLTAFSMQGQGPVFLFEGDISQTSKDRIMTYIAAEGDLQPLKASKKFYYRLSGDGESSTVKNGSGNIEDDIEALEEESWVSFDLQNKIIITANEEQMKSMLGNSGKIPGKRGHNGALVVLIAEKALLQAGMNSEALGESGDGDSGWDSNILRNTKQVAFMVAAAANKLAIEARLITNEPEMAEALASVVRGLISLVSFNGEMDAEAIALIQGTRVEAKGNALILSLAVDPDLVIATLSK